MKPTEKYSLQQTEIRKITEENKIEFLTATLLWERGITEKEEIRKFLFGSWEDLTPYTQYRGCEEIVRRLQKAIEGGETIVLYGDYDCDGIGAIAIFYLAFKKRGVPVHYYIPTRGEEGYGLNKQAIEKISESFHPDILLTADCGIGSLEEIIYAQSLGMEVLVTDHHTPGEKPPPCLYTDPCFTPELTQMCATGVAFTIVGALFGREEAQKYLDICAISTIADIVPLNGDNRIFVRKGLEVIRSGKARQGVKMLLLSAGCDMRGFSVYDVSFRIAPRLNAAGRLSTPIDALRVYLEDDTTVLSLLIEKLNMQNAERQQLNDDIWQDVLDKLKEYDFGKYRIVMLKGDWNKGVVGIVCSRITEYFHLPAVLLCRQEGTLSGSARSISGVNIYNLFHENSEKLTAYGGHAMAAGIAMKEEDFEAVRDAFNESLLRMNEKIFIKNPQYDALLSLKDVTYNQFREVMRLEPFGIGNPTPLFYDDGCKIPFQKGSVRFPLIKGKNRVGELVNFDGVRYLPVLDGKSEYGAIFTLTVNTFRNTETAQFMIKDFFFNEYVLSASESQEAFLRTFLRKDTVPKRSKSEKPTIYVCYTQEGCNAFLRLHPELTLHFRQLSSMSIRDSVVLLPENDFPFWFFGTVCFVDWVQPKLASLAQNAGLRIEKRSEDKPNFTLPSLEKLRSVFRFYMERQGQRFVSFEDCAERYDGKETLSEFFVIGYLLSELDLLHTEGAVITVNNKKTDPTQSEIYRYIGGNHEKSFGKSERKL